MTDEERLIREQLDRTEKLNAKLSFENQRLRDALNEAWAQLEYLDGEDVSKRRGTTNVTIFRIREALGEQDK